MIVFIVVSIIVLLGLAVAATLGRLGHSDLQMHPPVSSVGGWAPTESGPLASADIDDIRFDTAVRGYRMDQVDAMLARVRASLAEHEVARAPGYSAYPEVSNWPEDAGPSAEVRSFPSAFGEDAPAHPSRRSPQSPRDGGPSVHEKE